MLDFVRFIENFMFDILKFPVMVMAITLGVYGITLLLWRGCPKPYEVVGMFQKYLNDEK